jgi:hypothetical protein
MPRNLKEFGFGGRDITNFSETETPRFGTKLSEINVQGQNVTNPKMKLLLVCPIHYSIQYTVQYTVYTVYC